MNDRKQVILSGALVLGAVVIVAAGMTATGDRQDDSGMEGHNHEAMVAGGDAQPVRLSPDQARRIGVTFATVEHRPLDRSVEALGVVAYDETRLATVSPKTQGWIEQLDVDFTGAPVRAGQPLMAIYSPELVTAQEELALAARLARSTTDGRADDNARALLESARRRLAYWDIAPDDVRRIEETGEVTKTLTLRAPASGVVVEKNVVEGDRVTPGMAAYRIADLSRVWIEADVFERDLGLVREGQHAMVRFEAFPGEVFHGAVTYVYPTVSMDSRTGRVRLELPNAEGRLRPGMYARVDLDIPAAEHALVVPRSAVLNTGTRSLVFVQAADGTLEPREVTPGRSAGRDMAILAGLEPGERVVSSAAFLVDAESSLGALTAGVESVGEMDGMDGVEMDAMDDGHEGH